MTEAFADIHDTTSSRAAPDFAGHAEHPIIRLPFSVLINGRSYAGTGLSMVGAEATGLAEPHLDGKVQMAMLLFNFPGFAVSLPVQAAITAGSPEAGTLSLRFVEPTGPHLPQLRYILNSYLAGDLASVEGSLKVTDRGQGGHRPADRKRAFSLGGFVGGLARWVLVLGIAGTLTGFVGLKVYERFFLVPLPGLSSVALQGMSLRAVSAGQLDFVNVEAKMGEVAFAVRTASGDTLAVTMPCDCVVAPGHAPAGSTVLAGDEIMAVARPDAPTVISTQVDSQALRLLASGVAADVRLPDGTATTARLDQAELPNALRGAANGAAVGVNLVPEAPLDRSLAGTPAELRIKTDPFAGLKKSLLDLAASLGIANGASK